MARLIQKSGYIQGGRAARYMEYIAKRDGVEVLQSTEPVTKKQMQFLTKLLKDFPDAKELFEYADYLQTPNRGTASAFIAAALDTHLHELESESGYMAYIANRPRAEKRGGHGLFSAADVTDLKAAKNELETHAGKVWTFIFSLRREDAERLGYSKAAAWQNLLKQESHSIAEAMRIPPEKFRWYAAYHDEGHHPHIHMMAWSDDPKVGFLTQKGIASIRSKMTNEIFRDEMTELYIRKDAAYKESMQTAKALLLERIRALETGAADDPGLVKELQELSQALAQVGGKHVYSYLPKSVKAQVDAIVERLAQLPEVAACYDQWWQLKDEIAGYYGQNTPPHQPLTQRKEFRSLKNWIIREAEDISFSPSADSTEPGEKQSTEKTPPIRGSVDVQPVGEAVSARHIPANVVMRLLHHMGQILGRVCRSSHLRCESTPSAADGCRRSAWPWDTSEMTTRTSSSAMSTKTPCNRRYNAWVNLYISHPQKNGRPTRLTCHLFCVTGAKSSCRLDGSTGWPATTASLYAPTGGMIMLRGGAATPSASCGSSMTRPSRKPCPYCWVETDRASFPLQSRNRSRRSQNPLPCRSLT